MTSRPRRRALAWPGRLLLLAAVLASCLACVPPGNGRPGPLQPPDGDVAGRLAFIGADGNVYVTTAGASAPLQLTHDATAPAEGAGLSYHRLAWSPAGALAFAAVERSGTRARGRLYVVDSIDDPGRAPRLVAENLDHFFIYVYWSPDPGSRRLAYLVAEDPGVGLHLLDLSQEPLADSLLATGRPFYLSWAPGGQRLAWHAGPNLVVYDLAAGQSNPIAAPSAAFRAPTWSPDLQVPGRWLAVVSGPAAGNGQDGATTIAHLTAFSGTTPTPLLPLSGAEIAFSWSPDATHIAYAQRTYANDPFYGPIHLLTSQFRISPTSTIQAPASNLQPPTSNPQPLTPNPFRPLAFFWSPAGDRLAYLSWLDLPGETWAQWRVIDVATGRDRGYAAFRPSPLMQFALHSFDQYAQSHRFWSPDGRYLVYAARDRRGLDQIWLVDTRAAPGTDPLYIADGPLAYWSFD